MASSSVGLNGSQREVLRKALFRSPDKENTNKTPDALEALLNRIQVDIEVDNNLDNLRKEEIQMNNVVATICSNMRPKAADIHKQTLTKLREELTQISQDEWMYKPVDQIIGF